MSSDRGSEHGETASSTPEQLIRETRGERDAARAVPANWERLDLMRAPEAEKYRQDEKPWMPEELAAAQDIRDDREPSSVSATEHSPDVTEQHDGASVHALHAADNRDETQTSEVGTPGGERAADQSAVVDAADGLPSETRGASESGVEASESDHAAAELRAPTDDPGEQGDSGEARDSDSTSTVTSGSDRAGLAVVLDNNDDRDWLGLGTTWYGTDEQGVMRRAEISETQAGDQHSAGQMGEAAPPGEATSAGPSSEGRADDARVNDPSDWTTMNPQLQPGDMVIVGKADDPDDEKRWAIVGEDGNIQDIDTDRPLPEEPSGQELLGGVDRSKVLQSRDIVFKEADTLKDELGNAGQTVDDLLTGYTVQVHDTPVWENPQGQLDTADVVGSIAISAFALTEVGRRAGVAAREYMQQRKERPEDAGN